MEEISKDEQISQLQKKLEDKDKMLNHWGKKNEEAIVERDLEIVKLKTENDELISLLPPHCYKEIQHLKQLIEKLDDVIARHRSFLLSINGTDYLGKYDVETKNEDALILEEARKSL